jgi:hypothetical protein
MTTQAPVDVRAAGPLATEPTPATVMQFACGLMAVKHLSAASELGLYEPWPTPQRLWTRSPLGPRSPAAYTGSRPMSDVTSRRTRREWT